jgi:signal transduction histidine kinase
MRHAGPTLAAIGLLGLLLVLATLQYRWLGQLGDAELARLRAASRASTGQLASDFDREITRAFLWLRPDRLLADEDPDAWAARFAERYWRWMREAPHPRILRAVFLLDGAPGQPAAVRRFSATRAAFESASLPVELSALGGPDADPFAAGPAPRRGVFDPLREGGPALIHHVPTFGPPGPPLPQLTTSRRLVVLLDRTYLLAEFVPALLRRHLPASELVDPRVQIVRTAAPGDIVYSSPGEPMLSSRAEAAAELFAVRMNEANSDLLGGGVTRPTFGRAFAARGATRGMGPAMGGEGTAPIAFRALPPTRPSGLWRLTVTHRGGSLDQVVAASRRRNLVISSGILLVLAAGVLMTGIATHRAQQLARAEREFVAGVSHELSTPLSVICVAGENLADGLVIGEEPVRRYGTLVRDEGRRLRALVEQVLDFSSPPATPARHSVDLRAVITAALDACRLEIEGGDFDVRADLPTTLPPVDGDPVLLQGAVQNLIANALKYSGDSRRVDVHVDVPGGEEEVWITVEDLGLGVDPREQRRIFEPFYRGAEARRRQIRGSGLGLTLVRRTAEQHGGRVTVRSSPGAGSAFTIRLPVSRNGKPSDTGMEAHAEAHPAR